jgi:hypothetical protein
MIDEVPNAEIANLNAATAQFSQQLTQGDIWLFGEPCA